MLAVDERRAFVAGIKPDGVCMRSPEIQNCKFFNSRDALAMATTATVAAAAAAATVATEVLRSAGKYLRLTYTNIAGDEGCVFKNLHRYILIKVS